MPARRKHIRFSRKTNPARGPRGISCFIVEKGTPGFDFGKKENKMGIRASITKELIFNNCRIPKENLVGKEGHGLIIAQGTLDAFKAWSCRASAGNSSRSAG